MLQGFRAARPPPPRLIDENFGPQSAFLEDSASRVVVLCTRRAGKSYGAALRLLRAAYAHPGASCLYVALTRDSAKRILWKDVLKNINRKLSMRAAFNETALSMTLPNGSVIYLLGADADDSEREKLLGQKYAAVVIDESASFKSDLKDLVYGVLEPAVSDYAGSIAMIGTPSNLKKGLFFELTQGQEPLKPGRWAKEGWSGHRWGAEDNPHQREAWRKKIAEIEASNPHVRETPLFQQHYLGRWVVDDSKLVYRFTQERNTYRELPEHRNGNWSYVLGVDLGHSPGPSAFVVCAYHQYDRVLYVLEAFKQLRMDVTDVANKIKEYQRRLEIDVVVIDNANKQAVAEMSNRHELALTPADKTGKTDFIELMNGELIQGNIRIQEDACQPLADEWAGLIWDERSKKREEHPNCANHLSDATLYSWRHCFQYLAQKEPEQPKEEDLLELAAVRRYREQHFSGDVLNIPSTQNWEPSWTSGR